MSKQGISTGTTPNDGTGDTLLAATLKINSNFSEIYNVFGDGANLVSFVSYATTAGYSTACGVASTSTYAQVSRFVTTDISINSTGVSTFSYSDTGGIVIEKIGVPANTPFQVGFAGTMLRVEKSKVGIGTSVPTSQLEVVSFDPEIPVLQVTPKSNGHAIRVSNKPVVDADSFVVTKDGKVGIASTAPGSKLTVIGDVSVSGVSTFTGVTHLNGSITEKVVGNFSSSLTAIGGTLTIDVSQGTVVLGGLTTSVTTWAFTNVTTLNNKATTVTIINDAGTAATYGDACRVNGSLISGGIRWVGGNAPPATNQEDILTFSIIRDSTGETRVYCNSSLNIS